MRCEVRLLGGLAERAGARHIAVEVAEPATVADLRAAVADQHPGLRPLLERVSVAVDLEVAGDLEPVRHGVEVALLPPVAGGALPGDPPAGGDGPGDEKRGGAGAEKRGGPGAEKRGGAGAEKRGGAGADERGGAGADERGGAGADERGGAGADERGGAGADERARVRADGRLALTGLRPPPLDLAGALAAVTGPAVGGTAAFVGTVRDHAADLDAPVVRLDYEAYPAMAEHVLDDVAERLLDAHADLLGIALLHTVGHLDVGDHTILVAAGAAHRALAFDVCRDALEEVKDRVPVFKREVTADGGHRWVGLPDVRTPRA